MAQASCDDCNRLLALYKGSVRMYREAVSSLSETLNDDFVYALERVQRLWTACQFAGDAMAAHQIQDHGRYPAMERMSPKIE